VKLPEGITAKEILPAPRPGLITVEFTVSVGAMMREIKKAMHSMGKEAIKPFRAFARAMRESANSEARVSGLESRYYVRGGLACPLGLDDIDALVKNLMRHPGRVGEDDEHLLMTMLTPENRARLAAAALRGYVENTPAESPRWLLVWYRQMGATTVLVS
jgi:hypothetical protein